MFPMSAKHLEVVAFITCLIRDVACLFMVVADLGHDGLMEEVVEGC